jgi:hypothetical protein
MCRKQTKITLFYFSSDSDHDDGDEIDQADSPNISPSIVKRRVNFFPKKNNNINGKPSNSTSPATPAASTPSPGTKMRRRRLRTTSRSGDDRISFRGRNPIYTAGIQTNEQKKNHFSNYDFLI